MTIIAWAECKNGHALTDPANVYINPQGHRRCRTCKRESDRRNRPERSPLITPSVKPDKHRTWAVEAWELMDDYERWLVKNALGYLTLEQAAG